MSLLGRLKDQLSRDQAELEADELTKECAKPGCTRIARLAERELAEVTGCVHSLAVQPQDHAPELQVELYDGTGMLRLVWLGRREIEGMRPGVYLTVRGRVALADGQLTMYNPAYHLLPGHA